ncbi:hypothetical protein SNEBB_003424 [Seison nebaliae]|nr:hypothetical protein SNEBB_003424 [Seison nebaliae]
MAVNDLKLVFNIPINNEYTYSYEAKMIIKKGSYIGIRHTFSNQDIGHLQWVQIIGLFLCVSPSTYNMQSLKCIIFAKANRLITIPCASFININQPKKGITRLARTNLFDSYRTNYCHIFQRHLSDDNRKDQKRRQLCPKCGGPCSVFPTLMKPSKFVICQNCGYIFGDISSSLKSGRGGPSEHPENLFNFHPDSNSQEQKLIESPSINFLNIQYPQYPRQQQKQLTGGQIKMSEDESDGMMDENNPFHNITPKGIHRYLDEYIIGQTYPKKVISVAVYNHYKRIKHNLYDNRVKQKKIVGADSPAYNFVNDLTTLPPHTLPTTTNNNNNNNNELGSVIDLIIDEKEPSITTTKPNGNMKKDENSSNKDRSFVRRRYRLNNINKSLSDSKIPMDGKGNDGKDVNSIIFKNLQFHNNISKSTPEFDNNGTNEKNVKRRIIDKSNILLLGPSGTGKTFLAQTIATYLNVPFAICDCTTLTQAGYVGEDIESVVSKLYQNSNSNMERCQQGIIFLDEVDKIAASNSTVGHHMRDVGGEGVQQGLLKLMEGTLVTVPDARNPGVSTRKLRGESVQIDTTNILFVVSGAFVGMDAIISQRKKKQIIGFNASSPPPSLSSSNIKTEMNGKEKKKEEEEGMDEYQKILGEEKKSDELLNDVEAKDLVRFGMIPEFIGRIPIIANFHSLDENMLKRILIEPSNSVVSQFEELFFLDKIKLELTSAALSAIARKAKMKQTGARGLRAILESVLLDAMYETPSDKDVYAVKVMKSCVTKGEPVTMLRKRQSKKKSERQDEMSSSPNISSNDVENKDDTNKSSTI